ncbi:HD-GYP domain-containing protein [Acidocella sp. C78]|uniref:HD-GYP domain-containing protein n=1 Tax=Acidocella sp. C78 TaxID=1671486 RepID=UPI00191BB1A0|nr:HD domain-containing protein [Acidocella sp. C78]
MAAVFADISQEGWLWQGLAAEGLDARVQVLEPSDLVLTIDEDGLDRTTAAFADVIDAKSSFTSGHSRRVAFYADAIGARIGWTGSQRRRSRRGALLHDIGKLGVSNLKFLLGNDLNVADSLA